MYLFQRIMLSVVLGWMAQPLWGQGLPVSITKNTAQVGAKLGYVSVDKMDKGTTILGLVGDYAIADNVLIGGSLDYWREGYYLANDRRANVTDVALGFNSKLIFTDVRSSFRPFVLAGIAAHRISVEDSRKIDRLGVDPYEDEFVDAEGEFGVDLGAGAMYRLKREIDLNAEIRWRNILEEVVDYDQVAFTGGLSYLL